MVADGFRFNFLLSLIRKHAYFVFSLHWDQMGMYVLLLFLILGMLVGGNDSGEEDGDEESNHQEKVGQGEDLRI